ncbi:DEAD/DEAH box helicase family protein [Clostridium sp.]|uniref:DEAD/DEAH box helicase family protein n=1 Tax=Clostridium sp. TaxID=1506 RepID=UPI00344DD72D
MGNFKFLEEKWPMLYNLGEAAESTQDNKELIEQFKKREKELESELNSLRESQKAKSEQELKIETKERKDRGKIASSKIELSEAETRNIIDEQLRSAGWEVDTKFLRYSKGTRPQKNKNIAIAEWPTYSEEKGNGAADYALFIGLKLVGIIEAKSGVHFLDCRNSENHPKALQGWYSPEKLNNLLEQDIHKENESLDELDFDFLQDENGVGLRYYQVEAIKVVEEAIKRGDKSALVAMATGTGKTRTVLGLIYRLLKTKRFKRILFLVDRTELGTQALDTFTEVKIEDLKTLNEIYNINGLEDKNIEK